MSPSQVHLHFTLYKEKHEVLVDLNNMTYEEITSHVHDLFDETRRPKEWVLIYRDNEDDLVTVKSVNEFEEACRVFLKVMVQHDEEQQPIAHFQVVPKLTLQEQLAPVLSAVEEATHRVKMVASETKESIRQSTYVERGRTTLASSAAQTRTALLSARRGVSQNWTRISTVVVEELTELQERVRHRSPVDEMDDGPSVALMATNVEQHIEEERHSIQNEVARSDESALDGEDDHLTDSVVEDIATASGTEWEIVTIDVRDMDVGPWGSAIRTIRDVVPHTNSRTCIELLNKYSGNINAVLMELTNI